MVVVVEIWLMLLFVWLSRGKRKGRTKSRVVVPALFSLLSHNNTFYGTIDQNVPTLRVVLFQSGLVHIFIFILLASIEH